MYHHQWLYHETLAPAGRIVKSEQEEAALGEGWVDTPAKFGAAQKVPVPTIEEVLKAGYSPEAAPRIVARQQALAAAVASGVTDPALIQAATEAALAQLVVDKPHAPTEAEAADLGRPVATLEPDTPAPVVAPAPIKPPVRPRR